jgi:hypothetical protein
LRVAIDVQELNMNITQRVRPFSGSGKNRARPISGRALPRFRSRLGVFPRGREKPGLSPADFHPALSAPKR